MDRKTQQTTAEILKHNAGAKVSRVAKSTKTVVTLYDGIEAQMDVEGGRWQTVCDTHSNVVAHRSKSVALSHLSYPEEWCDDCQKEKLAVDLKPQTRLFVVVGCHGDDTHPPCPNRKEDRTAGSGYALDYTCSAAGNKLIDGYVEWPSEMSKAGDFPKFCPLEKSK